MGLPDDCEIRPVTDDDAGQLIELIGSVYGEYPGCVLDLDGVDADLTEPASSFRDKGGDLWVVTDDQGEIVACCGWAPTGPGTVELKRLYVRPDRRRAGLGAWLVEQVERVAHERGAGTVTLWSDTRFTDAHRLYRRCGYRATNETRQLHDPSDTTERRFERQLSP